MKNKFCLISKLLGLTCFFYFSYSLAFAELLVDPDDPANTNNLVLSDAADYDQITIEITLPTGLNFFGNGVGETNWYVSTNGGLFPSNVYYYNQPVTDEEGCWVFTDDLEVYESSGQFISTSDNTDYFAVTWKVGTHAWEQAGASNFQLIWFKNDTTLNGCSFLENDIVFAYGQMNGVFNDNPPQCGIGLTNSSLDYITIPGASTNPGEEGWIPSFDTLPGYVIFRWNGTTYDVLEDECSSTEPLDGYTSKNRDMYQIDYFNTVIWSKYVPSNIPASYNVYRNGQFLTNVNALYTQYQDHNLRSNTSYTYLVKAVNSSQVEYDTLGELTLTTKGK